MNFGDWNLDIVCSLVLGIWDFPQEGSLAQSVEHLPFKQSVTGSNPVRPTIYLKSIMASLFRNIPKRKILLSLGDFLLIVLALAIAFLVIAEKEYAIFFFFSYTWLCVLIPIIWFVVLFLNKAYDVERAFDVLYNTDIFLKTIIISTIIIGFILYLFSGLFDDLDFPQRVFLLHAVLIIILLYFWRFIFGFIVSQPKFRKRVLVLGVDWTGREIAREIFKNPNLGYLLVGFIDDRTPDKVYSLKIGEGRVEKVPVLGDSKAILQVIRKFNINMLVNSFCGQGCAISDSFLRAIYYAERRGIELVDMPDLYEELTGKIPIKNLEGSWVIFNQILKDSELREFTEILFNVLLGVAGAVLFLPFLPFIVFAQQLSSRGPIFFKQERVGKRGKTFLVYKFRTMIPNAEKYTGAVWAKDNDPRIIKVGKFFRKTRIDEVPQIINILRRDMNIVGPRPERPEFVRKLEKKIPFYQKRHIVRPGLTGWAQVSYPYGASVEDALEKLQYDLYYIKHCSIFFDIVILLKTIRVVLTVWGGR